MEQGKKRVFSAGFKLHEQLLFSFPSWQGGNVGVFFFFWRSHCQGKSQRDLYFSHLHSFRVLAAFVVFVYSCGRQVPLATQASLTEPRRDTWHAWSFTCTTASYVQLYQVSHFNTARISLLTDFFCLVTQSSSSVKNGCVEKDDARISSDWSVLCGYKKKAISEFKKPSLSKRG